jgi:hypothetical protein
MRRPAIAVLVVLSGPLVQTSRSAAAEVENWTGDYLYSACENGVLTEGSSLDQPKKLADSNWCVASLEMAMQASSSFHKLYETEFPKQIDAKTNSQVAAKYVVQNAIFGSEACFPDNINAHQLAMVLVKFGREHPENLHVPALEFSELAFSHAFSCNRLK